MKTHSQSFSTLAAVTSLIAGIAAGRAVGASSFIDIPWVEQAMHPMTLAVGAFLLTIPSFIIQRRERIATATVLAAVFVLGVFLISNSDITGVGTSTDSVLPPSFTDYMDERRGHLSAIYRQQGLSHDEYSIVAAMTLGEKQRISKFLKEAYNISGASHVFALSGLHLSIIYIILTIIIPRRRFPRCGIAMMLATLWMYVLLTGGHASIVRAAVMLSIYSLFPLLKRRTDSGASLAATCFLLLVIHPSWLFDIGFQMSFMAVWGIVTFYGHFSHFVDSPPSHDPYFCPTAAEPCIPFWKKGAWAHIRNAITTVAVWIWSILILSITAQVAVAPLVAYYFGRFSPYFLFSNLIVSPCTMLIIPLSFTVLLLGSLVPILPFLSPILSLCVTVLWWIVHILNSSMVWIAGLPGA